MIEYLRSHGVIQIKEYGDGEIRIACPFHDDIHPSASISTRKKVFNCFVCGGMSLVKFISQLENCPLNEAYRILDDIISYPPLYSLIKKHEIPKLPKDDNELIGVSEKSNPGIRYLEKRGVDIDVARQYDVRYVYRGKWAGSLLFPVYSNGYKGYQYRTIRPTGKFLRYFWERGSAVREAVYNIDRSLRGDSTPVEELIVVEGAIDTLKLVSLGFDTVGLLSNIFHLPQLACIIKMNPKSVLVYLDPDSVGKAKKIATTFSRYFPSYYVLDPPCDPGDIDLDRFSKLNIIYVEKR